MIQGADLFGFLVTFGLGFISGIFFGIVIIVFMGKSDEEDDNG